MRVTYVNVSVFACQAGCRHAVSIFYVALPIFVLPYASHAFSTQSVVMQNPFPYLQAISVDKKLDMSKRKRDQD